MNYTAIFSLSVRTERAYATAQDWIANDAPVLEQRFKKAALNAAINVFQFALVVIDWVSAQLDRADEYRLIVALACINSKRFGIQQLIKVVQLDERYQLSSTARKIWTRKGVIATSALDKVFCLN